VALTERNTLPLLEALRGHALDAAFLRPPVEAGEDVVVQVLLEEEMLVALPAGHPLASEASLPLSALRGETLLVRPRPVGLGLREQIVAACRRAGFSPIMGRHAPPQMSSVLPLVAAGLGVSVVPASMGHLLPGSIVCKPIRGARIPRAPVALAYRRSSRSPAVAAFVEFALAHAGATAPARSRGAASVASGLERSRSGRRSAPSRR
jgi:DNA-binding transcriptional LysR family regulator